MAVLLPLATLLLGKALSKTKQHKAVFVSQRDVSHLPYMVLTIPANFHLPPDSMSPAGQWGCSAGGAVGTHPPPSLASDGVLGWKLHPRASPAHTKATFRMIDLGDSFRRHGAFR